MRSAGTDFLFEIEAYDPGNRRFCDNLEVGYFNPDTLPVTHSIWSQGNCYHNESYPEELKVHLSEAVIQSGTWYSSYVQLLKRRSTPIVDPITYNAEVNLSFAHWWDDSWLGKFNYKQSPAYDFASSDPAYLW